MAARGRRLWAFCAVGLLLVSGSARGASVGSRDLPTDYTAGSTFVVTLNVLPDFITEPVGMVVTEYLPAGWTIDKTASANPYSKYQEETHSYKWLYASQTPLAGFTISYVVVVPADASGLKTFSGTLESNTEDPIAIGGDTTINSRTVSVAIPLSVGWNLISLPVEPATAYKAQDILTLINAQGGAATEIDRWYNSTWEGHINGLPFANFDILVGKGYFVKCTGASTLTITGMPVTSLSISLNAGWNLVGIPKGTYVAQTLLNQINGQGGTAGEVDRWYNSTWEGHINNLPFANFSIEAGKGYFIKCTGGSTAIF